MKPLREMPLNAVKTGDIDGSVPNEIVYHVGAHDVLAAMMLVFGAFSWGIVALFGVDPVSAVFGVMTPMTRGLHAFIGLASLYTVVSVIRALKQEESS